MADVGVNGEILEKQINFHDASALITVLKKSDVISP